MLFHESTHVGYVGYIFLVFLLATFSYNNERSVQLLWWLRFSSWIARQLWHTPSIDKSKPQRSDLSLSLALVVLRHRRIFRKFLIWLGEESSRKIERKIILLHYDSFAKKITGRYSVSRGFPSTIILITALLNTLCQMKHVAWTEVWHSVSGHSPRLAIEEILNFGICVSVFTCIGSKFQGFGSQVADQQGKTKALPTHTCKNIQMVMILAHLGADMSIPDCNGCLPMHWAAYKASPMFC